MDPEFYAKRAKVKSLPLDFQYQDAVGYVSNWDYLKNTFSNYHFDKWKYDEIGDWYHPLGRFNLPSNIDAILSVLEEESKKTSWHDYTTKELHPKFIGKKNPLHILEEYDREVSGIKGEYTQIIPDPQILEIQNLATYWKMERWHSRIHIQMPGQAWAQHLDKVWHFNPADPTKMMRIIVALRDYEPGQMILFGNTIYTRWRAGDVITFDTHNVPHGSVNLSKFPRPFLVITGIRTEFTDLILRNSHEGTMHQPR